MEVLANVLDHLVFPLGMILQFSDHFFVSLQCIDYIILENLSFYMQYLIGFLMLAKKIGRRRVSLHNVIKISDLSKELVYFLD